MTAHRERGVYANNPHRQAEHRELIDARLQNSRADGIIQSICCSVIIRFIFRKIEDRMIR